MGQGFTGHRAAARVGWPSPELASRLDEIASSADAGVDRKRWPPRQSVARGKRLNRCAAAAYSAATNVKGERCGEQGAEAVEPRGQETEAE